MKEYISLDCHKHYSLLEREGRVSRKACQRRIEHERGAIREALKGCEAGTPVAVEATGNWYWIVQEIEEAKLVPLLVHPRKAKLMMGMINKTDRLDVHGLNRLQRNGTLPTVWIPPAELRDVREVTRARILWGRERTWAKNRVQAMLSKYGLQLRGVSDPYGAKGREELNRRVQLLPQQTQYVTGLMLDRLAAAERQIRDLEKRMESLLKQTPDMGLLQSLPGIGAILAPVLALEIGDVRRFSWADHLAAYAGTTPRVHSSGGKTHYGRLRPDVNRYLQWALVEAANSICVNARRRPERHVSQLYLRLRARRGHHQAIGAVARHLAEAAFHVLHRQEPYREPVRNNRSIQGGVSAVAVMSP